jgi:hypothetical protein
MRYLECGWTAPLKRPLRLAELAQRLRVKTATLKSAEIRSE